jgi:hypothetical protein
MPTFTAPVRGHKGLYMAMTMAVVDHAALERALEQLRAARTENADVQAAVATLECALNGSEGHRLLATTEAADILGVRSVNIVKYCVLGKNMLHSVKIYDMRAKPLLLGRERDAGRAGRRQRRA